MKLLDVEFLFVSDWRDVVECLGVIIEDIRFLECCMNYYEFLI